MEASGKRRVELIEQIRSALLRSAGIEDCAVRERTNVVGEVELVAYVAGQGAAARRELSDSIGGAAAIVATSAIPLTPSGEPDFTLLEQFPVLDDRTVAECEAVLAAPVAIRARELRYGAAHPVSLQRSSSSVRSETAVPIPTSGRLSVAEGPVLDLSDAPRTLTDLLRRNVHRVPGNWLLCVRNDGAEVQMTWAELAERASAVLNGLRLRGVKPGDRVALQCEELDETLTAFWACHLGGFVAAPLGAASAAMGAGAAKRVGMYKKLRAATTIASEPWVGALATWLASEGIDTAVASFPDLSAAWPDHHWHESEPDSWALMLFTSGSTGVPKGVQHTHRTLISHAAASAQMQRFTSDDVQVNWFPLDHIGGIQMAHMQGALKGESQVHVPSELILRNPLAWIDYLSRFRATWTWAPNFAYGLVNDRILEAKRLGCASRGWDLSRLKLVLNGGEAVVARTARLFLRLLAPYGLQPEAMRPAWGMSETASVVAYSPGVRPDRDDAPCVEVGVPVPGISFRIIGPNGAITPEGEPGRLQVRGCSITPGYFENPEMNAASFAADGWFETGDLAMIVDGRLTITGRSKDVVIINGANYFSHEIEAAVDALAGVDSSFTAACGVRQPGDQTEQLCVFFHPLEDAQTNLVALARQIRARVLEQTGAMPHWIIPVERNEVPKTNIGKIQRAQLKADFEAGLFRGREVRDSKSRVGVFGVQWVRSNCPAPANTAVNSDDLGIDIHFADSWESALTFLESLNDRTQRVFVVTRGAARVIDGDKVEPALGAISGLLRSFAASSGMRATHLDTDGDSDAATKQVALELAQSRYVPQVAYRGNQRFEPGLSSLAGADEEAIKPSGIYLVTGGLGGVGLRLCRHLAERYDARLLITGRRNLEAFAGAVEELASIGAQFIYVAADVADENGMRRAVESAERQFGGVLNAVFHLAGELGVDSGNAREAITRLLPAKLGGALALGNIVRERAGARLILFSSVNALFGSGSLLPYSAANAALDLAAEHLAAAGIRAQSINWSSWEGPGMSAQTAVAAREASLALGFQSLTPEMGWEALSTCLAAKLTRIAAGLDGTNPRLRWLLRDESQPLEQMVSPTPLPMPLTDRFGVPIDCAVGLNDVPEEASKDLPITDSEREIAAIFAELVRTSDVGRHDSFFTLGGDSLSAMRLLNRIDQKWGVRISLRTTAERPTVASLAASLDELTKAIAPKAIEDETWSANPEQLLAELDGLDDNEVERLLARLTQ